MDKNITKEILCPDCLESIRIIIVNYRTTLYECKNGHKFEKILLNELENKQKELISNLICNKCSKKVIYEEISKCYTCNKKFMQFL